MTIEECKAKVIDVTMELCGGIIVDEDALPDDWDSLATELAEMARHAMVEGCRLASYAGIATKKAR